MNNVTKDEFNAWKAHPVTQAVFDLAMKEVQDRAAEMLTRRTIPNPMELENIRGRAQGFSDLKEMEYQDAE